MKKVFVMLMTVVLVAASHGAVLVYEGFGDAVNNASIAGYSGTSAESGLAGTWSVAGGAGILVSSATHDFIGIAEGYTPETTGGNQHWLYFNSEWNVCRATRPLSGTIDMTVDGTWYMSHFSICGDNNTVTQMGLNNGTNELMWGNGYTGSTWQGTQGVAAYYGAIGSNVRGNADGTGYDGTGTNFWVAKLVKSNSATTDDLVVSIMFYDLGSTTNTIDDGDPAVWTRVISLTGVSAVFNTLQLKLDGGWGNQPSIDEIRIGQSWGDVTGKISEITMNAPLNGASNIPVLRTSPLNDLTFTVNDANIVEVDVQFGLENDPNLTAKPAYKIVANLEVTPGEYTVNLESLAADLSFLTTYYWKVIGYEPNDLGGGLNPVPGPVWSFTTRPEAVLIDAVVPAFTAVEAGADAVLTVTGAGIESYQWYKIGDPDILLTDGANYGGVNTDTLTIFNVQHIVGDDDEGYYYCIGSNSLPSSASNRDTGPGRVMTKRLTSRYPFEVMNVDVDPNGITPDVVGEFDMRMTNEAASAGLPVLGTDVVAAALGTYSLVFDNADEATDPNGQFALIANDVAKYEDITIGLWVKYNGGNNWQRIYDLGSSTTNYMFLTPYATGGGLRFAIMIGSGEQQLNAAALTVGEWTHVVVTIDGNTGRLYVNGELVDTNTGITYNPISVTQTNNLVGKSQFADPEFNGLIDELMIYNYALTTEEIAQDYIAVKGGWVCNNEVTVLPYDYDGDCMIGLGDFAIFAATWLDSNRIY